MKQTRIYKPGTRPVDPQPRTDGEAHSGQSRNGTGHASDEAEAKPFPLHCLPPDVEAMARAICASVRVPEALAGCCALAALSCSIGAGLQIRSGHAQPARANLYIIPSGESASGKSSAFAIALLPFIEFHDERKERWKTQVLPGLETDKETLEDDIEELRRLRKRADDESGRSRTRGHLAWKIQRRQRHG